MGKHSCELIGFLVVAVFATMGLRPAAAQQDAPAADMAAAEATVEEAPPASVAVYLGREPSVEAAATTERVLANLSPPVVLEQPAQHLAALITGEELVLLGNAGSQGCEGDTVLARDYLANLAQLQAMTESLDDLRPLAQQIQQSRVCLAEPVSPDALASPSFLMGLYEFGEKNDDTAGAAFSEALVLDLEFPWDLNYPPDAQLLFSNAKMALVDGPRVRLRLSLPPGSAIWVDGHPVQAPLDGVDLVLGRHLIQVGDEEGAALSGTFVETSRAGDLLLLDPATFGAPAGTDPDRMARASALFAALSSSGTEVPQYVVDHSAGPTVWQWDPAESELVALAGLASDPLEQKARSFRVAGGAMVGAGAAMAAAGAVLAGTGWSRAEDAEAEMIPTGGGFSGVDTALYDEHVGDHRDAMHLNHAGWVGVGVGAAALAVGVPLLVHGTRLEQGVTKVRVYANVSPDSAWLGVSGRF